MGDEEDKDAFYSKLQETIDGVPRWDVRIVMGDFYAKIGKEVEALEPAIGLESIHDVTAENGIRLVSLANANEMVVGGTLFAHKDIHKATWRSPDGRTENQIDHILIG